VKEELNRIRAVYDRAIKTARDNNVQELAAIHNAQAEFVNTIWEVLPLLFAEIDRLTRERDAAVADLISLSCCSTCKHLHKHCKHERRGAGVCFEWRGVQEVKT